MSLHEYNIEQKTEVIIEHFRRGVMHRLGDPRSEGDSGHVLAPSRGTCFPSRRISRRTRITTSAARRAFSGKVTDPDSGIEYTEPGIECRPRCRQADQCRRLCLKRFASPD